MAFSILNFVKTKKTLKIKLYDIKEAQPPNKKWCLCVVKDYNSKKKFVRIGYYDNGTLWVDEGEKAYGLGHVLWWIPTEEIETQFQPTTSKAVEVDP